MIPVLGIFTVNSLDAITALIKSIDYPIDKCAIVCNSKSVDYYLAVREACVNPLVNEFIVTHCPYNMGYSASLNYVVKMHCDSEYWLFAGDDTVFAAGDLQRANETIQRCEFLGAANSINFGIIFGVTQACIEKVGFFDENIHPTNWEDFEYVDRVKHLGVHIERCEVNASHVGSGTYANLTQENKNKFHEATRLNEIYYFNKKAENNFKENRLNLRERAKKLVII